MALKNRVTLKNPERKKKSNMFFLSLFFQVYAICMPTCFLEYRDVDDLRADQGSRDQIQDPSTSWTRILVASLGLHNQLCLAEKFNGADRFF